MSIKWKTFILAPSVPRRCHLKSDDDSGGGGGERRGEGGKKKIVNAKNPPGSRVVKQPHNGPLPPPLLSFLLRVCRVCLLEP